MTTVPTIRQVVVLVPDLEAEIARARDAFGFTSGTTSGVFGSIRNALLLSITMQPDFTAKGAN